MMDTPHDLWQTKVVLMNCEERNNDYDKLLKVLINHDFF